MLYRFITTHGESPWQPFDAEKVAAFVSSSVENGFPFTLETCKA